MSEKIGVMLCGHGSRDVDAIREFQALAHHLAHRLPQYEVDSGFLEFATPIIRTGLDALKAKGVSRILAVPGMLFAAGHVKNDIPSELNAFAAEFPELDVQYGRDLAIEPKVLRAAADRISLGGEVLHLSVGQPSTPAQSTPWGRSGDRHRPPRRRPVQRPDRRSQ